MDGRIAEVFRYLGKILVLLADQAFRQIDLHLREKIDHTTVPGFLKQPLQQRAADLIFAADLFNRYIAADMRFKVGHNPVIIFRICAF